MRNAPRQKLENIFAFVPNGGVERRYRERRAVSRSPEEIAFNEGVRADFDEIRDDDGRHPTPEIARIARGCGTPLSVFARTTVRAAKKGADVDDFLIIVDRLRQFIIDVFRKYGTRAKKAA